MQDDRLLQTPRIQFFFLQVAGGNCDHQIKRQTNTPFNGTPFNGVVA